MTSPNANAGPADVANKIDGLEPNGNWLHYRIAAMLYDANMFGLNRDYAYPEGSNVSPSLEDQVCTLAKLLTRTQKLADGNDYTLWDAVFTCAKWVLTQDVHINDNEKNSVNKKAAT